MIIIRARPRASTNPCRMPQDLRLRGDVERGAGFVGDQQARLAEQRHGDQHALAHAARQHASGRKSAMRCGIGHAHLPENVVRRARSRPALPRDTAEATIRIFEDRAHLVADREHRVQRGRRDPGTPSTSRCPAGVPARVGWSAVFRRSCAVEAGSGRPRMRVGEARRSRPMMARMVTLLPQPDSPTSATCLRVWARPALTSRSTLRAPAVRL